MKKKITFEIEMTDKELQIFNETREKRGLATDSALWMAAFRLYQSVGVMQDNKAPVVLGYTLSKLTGETVLNQLSGPNLIEEKP